MLKVKSHIKISTKLKIIIKYYTLIIVNEPFIFFIGNQENGSSRLGFTVQGIHWKFG